MIIRREIRKLAKDKGLMLSNEFINLIEVEIKERVGELITKCALISRHTARKTIKPEDYKLLQLLKK